MNAFSVDSKPLAAALALVLGGIGSSAKSPAYGYVLIESGDTMLTLTGSNGSHSVTATTDALCHDPLTACVEARKLANIVRLTPDDLLTFKQTDDRWLSIVTATSRHRLPTLPRVQFPWIDRPREGGAVIDGQLLASMLIVVSIAAETSPFGEQRWQAMEFDAKDGKLSVTGCNGPRLCNVETDYKGEFYALVPVAGVKLIGELAKRSTAITLNTSTNLITARGEYGYVTVQLLSAPWPNWRMLIQSTYPQTVEFDAATMTVALRRALLPDPEGARVTIEIEPNRAILTCTSDYGDSRELVAMVSTGHSVSAFTGNWLLDLFKSITGKVVWQSSPGVPSRFTPKDPNRLNWQYIQMGLTL